MNKYAVTIHLVANSLEEIQRLKAEYNHRGSVEYQELQSWEDIWTGYEENKR